MWPVFAREGSLVIKLRGQLDTCYSVHCFWFWFWLSLRVKKSGKRKEDKGKGILVCFVYTT